MTEEERRLHCNYITNELPQTWARINWVKNNERRFNIEKETTWEITKYLYHSGTLSYVYELYASSILSIASAIDSYLSSIISPIEYSGKSLLSKRIQMAKENKKISPDLADELMIFNDKVRNHLVHPKGPLTHFFLGGDFDAKTGTWSKDFQLEDIAVVKDNSIQALKMDPIQNMKQVTEYSLLLFMRTVRDHLDLSTTGI